MIRIIKSNVLWFDGRRTRLMGAGSTFQADPALEARWVAEGVAEYADGAQAPAEPAGAATVEPAEAVVEPETADEPETDDDEPADLDEMTVAELREYADELGVELPAKARKADIVAAIEEAEEAPALEAAGVER